MNPCTVLEVWKSKTKVLDYLIFHKGSLGLHMAVFLLHLGVKEGKKRRKVEEKGRECKCMICL